MRRTFRFCPKFFGTDGPVDMKEVASVAVHPREDLAINNLGDRKRSSVDIDIRL